MDSLLKEKDEKGMKDEKIGIWGTNEFSDKQKKTLGSNLPYSGKEILVVSYSGGYGIHIPANGTNNVSSCPLVR